MEFIVVLYFKMPANSTSEFLDKCQKFGNRDEEQSSNKGTNLQ